MISPNSLVFKFPLTPWAAVLALGLQGRGVAASNFGILINRSGEIHIVQFHNMVRVVDTIPCCVAIAVGIAVVSLWGVVRGTICHGRGDVWSKLSGDSAVGVVCIGGRGRHHDGRDSVLDVRRCTRIATERR